MLLVKDLPRVSDATAVGSPRPVTPRHPDPTWPASRSPRGLEAREPGTEGGRQAGCTGAGKLLYCHAVAGVEIQGFWGSEVYASVCV